jgi:bis(5'-nucleosyl)-tetraphosphatase (symmetrical)
MSTYAIGDIQGCYRTLKRLLKKIRFDADADRLWLTGDLVNRGPRSLEVLRWVREQGDRVATVLGNHDLHLIARAFGTRAPRSRDTVDDVLEAPDREELIRWLRRRPFLHREGDRVLVHAGLLPPWTLEQAEQLAREIETVLASPKPERLLQALVAERPRAWRADLGIEDRWRVTVQAFTRLRTCRDDGRVCDGFSGPPERAPEGCHPWFELRDDQLAGVTVVCGHWATLGLRIQPGVMALDTGCVWGGELTAVRLEDGEIFQESLADEVMSR